MSTSVPSAFLKLTSKDKAMQTKLRQAKASKGEQRQAQGKQRQANAQYSKANKSKPRQSQGKAKKNHKKPLYCTVHDKLETTYNM